MAAFDPQLPPAQIPWTWRYNSKPISQPLPDKSEAISLDTAGKVSGEAVGVAEHQDQYGLKQKVRAGVDALRDTATMAYENVRNAQMTGTQPADAAAAVTFGNSLVGQPMQIVPPSLQQGLKQANTLGSAISQNGGRASNTLYFGQLKALAKKLRTEYPGHVDLVDEEISKISGVDPANAYMRSLLTDIAHKSAVMNEQHNKVLSMGYEAVKNGMPGVYPYVKAYELGLPNSEDNLMRYINHNNSQKYIFDQWQRDRSVKLANREDQATDAKGQFQQEASAIAYRDFHGVLAIPGLTDPATIQRMITDEQDGNIVLSGQQQNQLLSAAVAARNVAANDIQNMYNKRGYAAAIKDDGYFKTTMNTELGFYDRLIDQIKNKEYGSLFEGMRRLTALQTGSRLQTFSDPTIGPYMQRLDALTKFAGPNVVNWLSGKVLSNQKIMGSFSTYFADATLKAATPDDLRNDGQVKSLYADISKLQQAQRQGQDVPKVIYKKLPENVDIITNPKAPDNVKTEVAKYMFNPQNWKLMDAYKMDFTDANGKFHPGKYSVFDTMTEKGITDELWSLKNRNVWNMYKEWSETSFAKLYRDDLNNLNNIAAQHEYNFRILWDSDNNMFKIDDGKGGSPTASGNINDVYPIAQENYIKHAQEIINRLNAGLYNLSNIEKKETSDPTAVSAYLLGEMGRFGFRPNASIGGLPQKFYDAILNSTKKEDLRSAFEKANQ